MNAPKIPASIDSPQLALEASRALNRACYDGRVDDALAWLAAGADPAAQGASGKGALHYCAMAGRVALCEALALARPQALDARDGAGMTPLHLACRNGQVGAAKALIECGASASALDDFGRAPLECFEDPRGREALERLWLDRQAAARARETLAQPMLAARLGGLP
jgi:hypothetical protein